MAQDLNCTFCYHFQFTVKVQYERSLHGDWWCIVTFISECPYVIWNWQFHHNMNYKKMLHNHDGILSWWTMQVIVLETTLKSSKWQNKIINVFKWIKYPSNAAPSIIQEYLKYQWLLTIKRQKYLPYSQIFTRMLKP